MKFKIMTTADIYHRLISGQTSVGVIGVGYVGLPVATAFSRHYNVIGFDIDAERICRLKETHCDMEPELRFSADESDLNEVSFFIITVPTPVDKFKSPDLSYLIKATETAGRHLKPGDFVVFESSVYPGCTEDICIPILEKSSGLINGEEFYTGYSPERINPADNVHNFINTSKIISATAAGELEAMLKVYQKAIDAEVYPAKSIKVAEAAKMMENAQRNVNIALMNELSRLYAALGIDLSDVLDAAESKWNFVRFNPGLVGGHCIPVDPLYLIDRGASAGIDMPVLKACCAVNDGMAEYVADSLLNVILAEKRNSGSLKALLMGFTYKENIDDTRNSMAADLYHCLEKAGVSVDVTDCHADAGKVMRDYGIRLTTVMPGSTYDLVIVAVAHSEYTALDESYFQKIMNPDGVLADLKWIYKGKMHNLSYWSL